MKNLKSINAFINEQAETIPYESFKKGDKVICVDFKQRHLPEECFKFLKDRQDDIFEVLLVKDGSMETGKIHIGCVTKNNLPFLFSQKRFKKVKK